MAVTEMAGGTDHNQLKTAAGEMAAAMVMATVMATAAMTTTVRLTTAAMATVVAAAFLLTGNMVLVAVLGRRFLGALIP
jgi:hypothetical protein